MKTILVALALLGVITPALAQNRSYTPPPSYNPPPPRPSYNPGYYSNPTSPTGSSYYNGTYNSYTAGPNRPNGYANCEQANGEYKPCFGGPDQ